MHCMYNVVVVIDVVEINFNSIQFNVAYLIREPDATRQPSSLITTKHATEGIIVRKNKG